MSLTKNTAGIDPFADKNSFGSKAIILGMVTAAIVLVNILVHPSRFADYDSYVNFTDYLYHFSNLSWIYFEPISSAILLSLRSLLGSTEEGVNISHYILGVIFIIMNYFIIRKIQVSWQGYLVFIAFYGALLAFVTIRATPSYLLVTIACFSALEKRKISLFYTILAVLFHISALLSIPIVLALFFESKLDFVKRTNMKYFVFIIGIMLFAITMFGGYFSLIVLRTLESIPFLSKYLAYTANIDMINGQIINSQEDKVAHMVYAFVISIFVSVMLLSKNINCVRFRSVVLIGYVTFIFMQFSPVTAFRQSIFWMTPSILIYTWSKLYIGRYGIIPFLALCIALATYQFQSVYS